MTNLFQLSTLLGILLVSCNTYKGLESQQPAIVSDFIQSSSDHNPRSEKEASESYLKLIHRFKDDKVVLSRHNRLLTYNGDKVTVYRYKSDWYGDWLTCFIMDKRGYHSIELRASSTEERVRKESEFNRKAVDLANKSLYLIPETL